MAQRLRNANAGLSGRDASVRGLEGRTPAES